MVDHFYKPAHQHVYAAIRGLMATGQPVDVGHRRRRAAPQRPARRDRWRAAAARAAERHAGDLQRVALRQDRPGHGGAAPPDRRRQRDRRDRATSNPTTSPRRSTRPRRRSSRSPRTGSSTPPDRSATCCRWRWTSCRRRSSAATPSPARPRASTTSTRSSRVCSHHPQHRRCPPGDGQDQLRARHRDARRDDREEAGAGLLARDGPRRADPAHPVQRGRGRLAEAAHRPAGRRPTGPRSARRSTASTCRCSSTTTRGSR